MTAPAPRRNWHHLQARIFIATAIRTGCPVYACAALVVSYLGQPWPPVAVLTGLAVATFFASLRTSIKQQD